MAGGQRLMTEMFAAFCLQSSYSDNERCPWQRTSEAGSVKVLMAMTATVAEGRPTVYDGFTGVSGGASYRHITRPQEAKK